MISLLLNAEAFSLATNGIAGYVGYIRALGYAIAAVIVVVGSFSVYMDFMQEHPEVRIKVMKLCFSCVFLIAASTSLPLFFGLDGSASGGGGSGSSNSLSQDQPWDLFPNTDRDIVIPRNPYVIDLPGGGHAITWGKYDPRTIIGPNNRRI